jgi:LysR family transcriptional regulator, hydrogen peroxide-inducible genes activator
MQTQHVRYFLAVCDDLNFTRAAKKCGVSQPSVTNAVKRLEREVGGALFMRTASPPHVELTALARKLHPICVQMDALLIELGSPARAERRG